MILNRARVESEGREHVIGVEGIAIVAGNAFNFAPEKASNHMSALHFRILTRNAEFHDRSREPHNSRDGRPGDVECRLCVAKRHFVQLEWLGGGNEFSQTSH
jgi:hypothetical protein